MSNLSNNSFETVNAAATAIVNAQTRVQPSSARVCTSRYDTIKAETLAETLHVIRQLVIVFYL